MAERKGKSVKIDEVMVDGFERLSYESVDPENNTRIALYIPLDSTPESIASAINQASLDILENSSETVPVEQILKTVKFLKEEAKKVPGLKRG